MIEIVDPNHIIGSYPTLAIIGGQNLTRPAKINHLSAKNLPIFSPSLYHNLRTSYLYKHNKIPVTTAEFNRLSYKIYTNRIPYGW